MNSSVYWIPAFAGMARAVAPYSANSSGGTRTRRPPSMSTSGTVAGGHALDVGDDRFWGDSDMFDLDQLRAGLVFERPIGGDVGRRLGVGAKPDLALQPLRRTDLANQKSLRVLVQGYSAGFSASASAGASSAAASSAGASAASSAASTTASS